MIATMEQDTAAGRRVGETSKNVEGSATGGGSQSIGGKLKRKGTHNARGMFRVVTLIFFFFESTLCTALPVEWFQAKLDAASLCW